MMKSNKKISNKNNKQEFFWVDEGPLFSLSKDDGKSRFIDWEERPTERRCPAFFLDADENKGDTVLLKLL